jgi:hypothetical protein
MEQNQQLTVIPKLTLATIVAHADNRIAAIESAGRMMAKSGFYGLDNEAAGQVMVLTCLELGIGPLEYSRMFDCILGKPRKKAAAALVEFERMGGEFSWAETGDENVSEIVETRTKQKVSNQRATIILKLAKKEIRYSYSVADAIQEELWKPGSRWAKRPGNMLRARCISNGLGIGWPSIYAGELDDESDVVPATINLSNVQPVPQPAQPAQPARQQAAAVTVAPSSPDPTQPPPGQTAPAPFLATVPDSVVSAHAGQPTSPAAASLPVINVSKQLPPDLMVALGAAIGLGNMVLATKWLLAQKWINPGEDPSYLTVVRANKIIAKPAEFLRAITPKQSTVSVQ